MLHDAVYIHFRPMAIFVSFLLLLHARENIILLIVELRIYSLMSEQEHLCGIHIMGISYMRLAALFSIGIVQRLSSKPQ